MGEPQKDGEIGKDFLNSWKSMSVTENDTMDFDFGTTAKVKKKTFNFDNLDMDFSLDGDFDKISSFKVDMSDLDISSPAKKAGKTRERTKEETAGGNHQGKQDRFTFPFDFNDLDSFSFEPSLMKEKKSNKSQVNKLSLSRSESQGSEAPLTDDIGAFKDDVTSKLTASGGVNTSKIGTMVNDHGDFDPMSESSPSKSVRNDSSTAKSITSGNLVASLRARTSPEKTITTITQEQYQESQQPVQGSSAEPYIQDSIHNLPCQSVSDNESTQGTASDVNGEASSQALKASAKSGGEQNNTVNAKTGLASDFGNSELVSSPLGSVARSLSHNSENNKFGSQSQVSGGNTDDTEAAAQGVSDFEYNSITSVSRESLQDMKTQGTNLNSTSKLLLAPLSSGTAVDKLRVTEEKVSCVIRSKYFNRSNEAESQSQHALSAQTKLTSFESRRIYRQKGLTDERRESIHAKDAQSGSKLAGSLKSYSGEVDKGEPVQPGNGKSVIGLKISGECMNADGAQSGRKLTGYSRPQDIEVLKGESILQGSGINNKELHTLSSSEQTNITIPQKSVNPRLPVSSIASIKNLNNTCIEGNKNLPLTLKPDLTSLKSSSAKGASQEPLKSTFQTEVKSSRNMEQKSEPQVNTASKLAHSLGPKKQTPPTPSLKRKTFEVSNADMLTLNPAKRLSESPTEIRNFKKPSEKAVDKQTSSTLHIALEMNMKESDIAFVMENDDSIERAEACAKELEDICNMLKKKHEEAKEVLVRAIVNNNNLLILNHPIYEEKIRMVQKFASQLMSKEVYT